MWSIACELIRLMVKKPEEEHIEPKVVDVVPMIWCKDCKHLRIVNRQELAAMCSFHCYKFEPFADDYRECFCSWAERKEE